MMVRRQIQFTPEQDAALQKLAERSGKSVAEIVRESVEHSLATRMQPSRDEMVKRFLKAAGRFRSGKRDISVNHDKYLAEAYGDWSS